MADRTRAEQLARLWAFYEDDLKCLARNRRDYGPINQQDVYDEKVKNLFIAVQEVAKELTLMESFNQMQRDKNTMKSGDSVSGN